LIYQRSWQLRAQAEESEAQNLFIYFILLLLHSFCLLIYQRSWQLRAQAEESEAQNEAARRINDRIKEKAHEREQARRKVK